MFLATFVIDVILWMFNSNYFIIAFCCSLFRFICLTYFYFRRHAVMGGGERRGGAEAGG